jgi:hypothetical protein
LIVFPDCAAVRGRRSVERPPAWPLGFFAESVVLSSFYVYSEPSFNQNGKIEMKLITRELEKELKKNAALDEAERRPVLKLFGGGACTWLISEKEGDTLFGLCDLGLGCPELGYVGLSELEAAKFPPFGLGVERDLHFEAEKTLSAYANEALRYGSIQS